MTFSPLTGVGIVPSGAIANELSSITRRGFVPYLIDQFHQARPTTAALLDVANPVTGGLDPITVPVQGSAMTTTATTDYSGVFNAPAEQYGIQPAQFVLKGIVTPIGFQGMEAAIQIDHTIINRLKAKMVDASSGAVDFISTALFGNTTDNSNIIGLPGAVDDGTNLATYAGINRTSFPFWQAYRRGAGSVAPTRALAMQYITGLTANGKGEMPGFGVCGPGTWQSLANDYLGVERFLVDKGGNYGETEGGARSGFQALMVAGVPIYFDSSCPEGTLYLLNTKYLSFYIHTQAYFAFSGFESLIPVNQIGYTGVFLSLMELTCIKPCTQGVITGFTFATL